MNHFLEKHKIILQTIGPVFIGDGRELVKNEYILNKKNRIAHIIDQKKLFRYLQTKGLVEKYEAFSLRPNGGLRSWLYEEKIPHGDVQSFVDYSLDCDDIAELNTMKNVMTFQRDAYGFPYIPGSSLKGAIRTALLGADIVENTGKYSALPNKIRTAESRNRNVYLKKEIGHVESQFFHTKDREDRREDIRNDCMSGLRISDSKPLSVSDLTLCQKIDMHVDDRETALPILRECLKPGTKIEFDLVIDRNECSFTVADILKSVDVFLESYNKLFLENFKREELYERRVIYLGGGSGFATKTVLHQLLAGERDRVKVVSNVIDNTLFSQSKNEHKHYKDAGLGVSPHVAKLTEYDRRLVQMGACKIEIQ